MASRRDRTTTNHSYVQIANSGEVVPDQVVQSLFEPFRRIQPRTNTTDGVGLGLAIVKSIAAAHHANIEAHAQPQGGIAIRVSLPRDDGRASSGSRAATQ